MIRVLICGGLFLASCGWLVPSAQAAGNSRPEFLLASARLNRMAQAGNCVTPAAPPTCVTPAPAAAPTCVTPAPTTCCSPVAPCCPTPCIIYRHRHVRCNVCCGCCQPEPIKTVLAVKNPCSGCPVEIPVCLPGCTTGAPNVCCGTGIFGRDTISYTWPNGYAVRVAFKHTGDVIVTSYGS